MQYLCYPVRYIKITQKFSSKHYALDLAWTNSKTMPLYAPADATVEETGITSGAGKFIQMKFNDDDYTWHIRLQHCSRILRKKGDKVKRGQIVAHCGSTGAATGPHCHYELARTKKGGKYTNTTYYRKKYAVDPCKYTFVCDWQSIRSDQKDQTMFLFCKGTEDHEERNASFEQVDVIGDLNCRNGAGTKKTILGAMDHGIYNVYGSKKANGYKWYKVANDKQYWVADTGARLKHYAKEQAEATVTETDVLEEPEHIVPLTLEEKKSRLQKYVEAMKGD